MVKGICPPVAPIWISCEFGNAWPSSYTKLAKGGVKVSIELAPTVRVTGILMVGFPAPLAVTVTVAELVVFGSSAASWFWTRLSVS